MNSPTSALFREEAVDRIASIPAVRPIEASPVSWPDLGALNLTQDQVAARRLGIGGSDANTILSGDRERILEPVAREARRESS